MSFPAPYSVRLYRSEDLTRLQEITVSTFEAVSIDRNMEMTFGSFGEGDWATRKTSAIAEDCRQQPDGVFVALDAEGHIVGYITTRLNAISKIGWIPNLAVDPAHQAHGLGHGLLQHALDFLKQRGMEVAKIETLDQNPVGQKLYPRLGFVPVARQIHFAMRLTDSDNKASVTE